MKKKKEIEFNPADYDYMDNLPLAGWVWEFIRRDNGYQNAILKFKKWQSKEGLIESVSQEKDKLDIDALEMPVFVFRLFTKLREEYSVSPSFGNLNPAHFLLLPIKGIDYFLGIPNPEIGYDKFHHKPIIIGLTAVTWYQFEESSIKKHEQWYEEEFKLMNKERLSKEEERILEKYNLYGDENFNKTCAYIIENRLPITDIRNTIYLGISTVARIEDIENELNAIIKQLIRPRRTKIRTDKWKYYLITYDLKKSGKAYSEIADILADSFPFENPDRTFTEKNIENYHRTALTLINGEYKKYLYLEK